MKWSFLAFLFVFNFIAFDCGAQDFKKLPPPSMAEFKMLEDASRNQFLRQRQNEEKISPPTKSDETIEQPEPGELEKFISNKFFLPVIVILAVLIGTVFWLTFEHKKRFSSQPVQVTKKEESDEPPSLKVPNFRVGNLQKIGKREEQQDSFCISDIRNENALLNKGLLAVVADGMGGLEGGAGISQLVTDIFRNSYNEQQTIADAPSFLYETAQKAEKAVEGYIKRTGFNGGSTLVAVLIQGNKLDYISVGDSHIYHMTGGKIIQLNHDHTYGALLLKKANEGEVSQDEPYKNPKRHALTAYIGMGTFDTVDITERPVELQIGDKIFLCSDGVYNTLDNKALISTLTNVAHIAALKMEEAILSKDEPKQDNFTGIILEYVG